MEKRGDNRKNKFFASNSVEALIPCNEENWGVMKLQVHLGWEGGRIKQRVKGLSPKEGMVEQALVSRQLWLGGNSW